MSNTVLDIDKLRLNRGSRTILDNLSLSVKSGERVVIRGTNGSGKTTLLKAILGLLPVSGGRILFHGSRVGSREWRRNRKLAAWVPQEGVLHRFPVSTKEVVEVGLADRGLSPKQRTEAIDKALMSAGADHLADRCFHRLSGGERQRVSFARCLAQGADLLLLDEPAAAMDGESRERLVDLAEKLSDAGRAVIAVTHEETLFPEDRWTVYRLEDGRLC